jgi:hypothetical protein
VATYFAVIGNCQSRFIACVLDGVPGATAAAFTNHYQAMDFEGITAPMRGEAMLADEVARHRAAGHRIVILEQTSPVAAVGRLTDGIAADQVLRFPSLECFALWPTIKFDKARVKQLGIDRLLKIDRANIAKADEKADVTMLDAWDGRLRTIVPFDSPRHPSAILFADLITRLMARIEGVDFGDLDRWHERIAASRAIGSSYLHPIDGEIAAALECAWFEQPAYRAWRDARAHSAAGRWAETRDAIVAVEAAAPGQPDFFRMIAPALYALLATAQELTGDRDAAEISIQRAIDARRHSDGIVIRASIAERVGRQEDAMYLWRKRLELDPGENSTRLRLALLCVQRGEHDEAITLLDAIPPEQSNFRILEARAQAHIARAATSLRAADAVMARNRVNRMIDQIEAERAELQAIIGRLDSFAARKETIESATPV